MLRDVLVASLNGGQFPLAIIGLIMVIAVCRISPPDLSRLVFRLLDAAEAHEYGGICALCGNRSCLGHAQQTAAAGSGNGNCAVD